MKKRKILHILLSDKDEGTTRLVYTFLSQRPFQDSVLTLTECQEMKEKLKKISSSYNSLSLNKARAIEVIKSIIKIRKNIVSSKATMVIIWNQGFSIYTAFASIGYRKALHIGCKPEPEKIKGKILTYLSFFMGEMLNVRFIFCSNYLKKYSEELLGLELKKSTVIYNALGQNYLEPIGKNRQKNQRIKFLMVGALEDSKDYNCLIEAWAKVYDSIKNTELIIIGEGKNRNYLHGFFKDKKIDNVKFLGRRDDVKEIMDCADVFLFACKAEEGFGMALVEAYLRGMWIIAADTPAVRELASMLDGINSYRTGDYSDMAIKIIRSHQEISNGNWQRNEVRPEKWMFENEMVNKYINFIEN
ncbi:glycosyltransferase family 4 protein [Coleofasciculus sp. LEGE 07081]|nr:glycosyltransferase family 4 protein [Coleofasciculus sp. LEGE 07081]